MKKKMEYLILVYLFLWFVSEIWVFIIGGSSMILPIWYQILEVITVSALAVYGVILWMAKFIGLIKIIKP